MAEVVNMKIGKSVVMMLRGKLGNEVFQVRNGKQIVMHMPRKRSTAPSAEELARQRRFAEVQAVYNTLTPEEMEQYRASWKASGYKFNGKRYCTLRGFVFAVNYAESKIVQKPK